VPLSNAHEAGFENRIARVVADELRATLVYEWQPQRRGFVRKTIGAGLCDVWIGVPAGLERVLTTRPYYRSGYVFVNRADAPQPLESFDDQLVRNPIGLRHLGLTAAHFFCKALRIGHRVFQVVLRVRILV